MKTITKRLRWALGAAALVFALTVPGAASAAEGDLLRSLNPPNAAFGVSVAFDGTRLYYTNINDTTLHSVLADGTAYTSVPITGTQAGEGINAFSWDASRSMFWAAGSSTGTNMYLMTTGGVATLQFTITNTPGNCDSGFGCLALIDGVSSDGFNTPSTVWWSPDASQRVYEYDQTGTLIRFFDVNDSPNDTAPQCGFNYSSGVAVSSATEMYNVANGCNTIFRYTKTGTKVSFFTYQGQRGEDAECDDVTFAPLTAIWVRDVDGSIEAFEVVGQCPVGGGGGAVCPPDDEDDEDDDNDGLSNGNELLFFTILNLPDSDFDGVKDGNDDANGNGEDDEDEDDDDDECPDPDEDDDGTDDEDEDDEEDDD